MPRLARPEPREAPLPARSPARPAAPRTRPGAVRDVPAVTRAVAILRLLGKAETPQGVLAIAQALGIVPSTCLHILRVLVAEELVAFDAVAKRYTLSAGILAIAGAILRKDSIAEAMQRHLDALARRYGVTALGVEAAGLEHMVVVAISRSDAGLRLRTDIGSRYPALISATGRCVAAFGGHDPQETEARFARLRWDRPPTLAQWRADVDETRAMGYAVDAGCYITGVTIVAAPVLDGRTMRHCLVALGVSEQMQRIGHATLGNSLREATAALSGGPPGGS